MISLKYQAYIYACLGVIIFVIYKTSGINGMNEASKFAILIARNFLIDFYIVFNIFSIYKAKQLHFKLAQGWCIKKDTDVLIRSTTFIFLVIYRYHLALSSVAL